MKVKLLLILSFCFMLYQILLNWPDNNLHVIFCDIGQGDAILISYSFTQVLIDGGKDSKVLDCLSKNVPFWDKRIEVVIASHPDADHIGGLNYVLEQFQCNFIIINGDIKKTSDFKAFKEVVLRRELEKTKVVTVSAGDVITLSNNVQLHIVSPQVKTTVESVENTQNTETALWDTAQMENTDDVSINDRSIVINMRYNNFTVLLTGDLGEQGELALLKKGLIAKVDVLKVGHHGSKTSSTNAFLEKLRPEISVISSGKNNTYHHPSPEALSRLSIFSQQILRTDEKGTIRIASNGNNFWLY